MRAKTSTVENFSVFGTAEHPDELRLAVLVLLAFSSRGAQAGFMCLYVCD